MNEKQNNIRIRCQTVTNLYSNASFIHFLTRFFSLERVAGAAGLGGPEIPRDQFQIVLLAPRKNGTKQGRRCNHAT